MAYAAGVQDDNPRLFDLDREDGIVGHPLFVVCLEWPLVQQGAPGLEFLDGGAHRGLHVSHEIRLHRLIRPGDRLRTTTRLLAVEPRSLGAYTVVGFETRTFDGEPVADTRQGILYLGARLEGAPDRRPARRTPAAETAPLSEVGSFDADLARAVVYTECARIWNPIHTDPRVARASGLDGTIFHGTATLARCVSIIAGHVLDGDVGRIGSLSCRFGDPVALPSTVAVQAAAGDGCVRFQATSGDSTILREGIAQVIAGDGRVATRPRAPLRACRAWAARYIDELTAQGNESACPLSALP
jgi:acyl dehydratase